MVQRFLNDFQSITKVIRSFGEETEFNLAAYHSFFSR